MGWLEGQIALITGGASGLGRAVVQWTDRKAAAVAHE